MCLTKLTTEEPLTAQQNIFCWKKLCRNRYSYHREYYRYEIGSLQEKNEFLEIRFGNIDRGYHSWCKRGSYINPQGDEESYKFRKANYLFVIPKGTFYYKGYENDDKPGYVSSNIICLGHWLSPMTWVRAFKYQLENDKK